MQLDYNLGAFVLPLYIIITRSPVAHAQNAAACGAACDFYNSEILIVSEVYSQNVANVGGIFGLNGTSAYSTITSMCNIAGNDIQTCYECSVTGSNGLNDQTARSLLDAWEKTCTTFQGNGMDVETAYGCWLSVPQGSAQCSKVAGQPSSGSTMRGVGTWVGVALCSAFSVVMVNMVLPLV